MATRRKKLELIPDVIEALTQIHRDNLCTATRELWLHSTHAGDDEPGVEYRMATMFLKNVNVLEKDDPKAPILVHMHCIGGEWNDGMAIYDAIKLSPCPFTIIAYSQASSMSGIILQAAQTRLVMPNCEFMAHTGSLDVNNETRTAFTQAKRNLACHNTMLDIFAARCVNGPRFKGQTVEDTRHKLDQWMKDEGEIIVVGQEAVDAGFADAVIGDKKWPSVYDVWGRLFS